MHGSIKMYATIIVNNVNFYTYQCSSAYENTFLPRTGPTSLQVSFRHTEGYGHHYLEIYVLGTLSETIEKFEVMQQNIRQIIHVPEYFREEGFCIYICMRGEVYNHCGPFFAYNFNANDRKSIEIRKSTQPFIKNTVIPRIREKLDTGNTFDNLIEEYSNLLKAYTKIDKDGEHVLQFPPIYHHMFTAEEVFLMSSYINYHICRVEKLQKEKYIAESFRTFWNQVVVHSAGTAAAAAS